MRKSTSYVLVKTRYSYLRKITMLMIGAITSFSFANHALIDMNLPIEDQPYELFGPCDGYGGVVTIHLIVNCDGDSTPEFQGEVRTCASQAEELVGMWDDFCNN